MRRTSWLHQGGAVCRALSTRLTLRTQGVVDGASTQQRAGRSHLTPGAACGGRAESRNPRRFTRKAYIQKATVRQISRCSVDAGLGIGWSKAITTSTLRAPHEQVRVTGRLSTDAEERVARYTEQDACLRHPREIAIRQNEERQHPKYKPAINAEGQHTPKITLRCRCVHCGSGGDLDKDGDGDGRWHGRRARQWDAE